MPLNTNMNTIALGFVMTMDDVLQVFFSVTGVAVVTNLSTQNISIWKRNGVPEPRQYELYVKSGGELIPDGFDPEVNYVALAQAASKGQR